MTQCIQSCSMPDPICPSQHEPNVSADSSALAIYREEASAETALRASPVSFYLWDPEKEVREYGLNADGTVFRKVSMDSGSNDMEETNGHKRTESESQDQATQRLPTDTPWGTMFSKILSSTSRPTSQSSTSIPPSDTSSPQDYLPGQPHHEPDSLPTSPPPTTPREIRLHISLSYTNHQAYISRQGYYEGFRPSHETVMTADLEKRVPLEGLKDLRLDKAEAPLRVRNKFAAERSAKSLPPLKELWERGMRARKEMK